MQGIASETIEGLPAILDFKDLQNALRLSERSVWRMLADPALHAYRTDEGRFVAKADLIAWLEERNEL